MNDLLTDRTTISRNAGRFSALPLNTIAVIISHLTSKADLSRLSRTCRVFRYMTLAELYKEVNLKLSPGRCHAVKQIGLFQDVSSFLMGLHGLTIGKLGSLVRSLTLSGQWDSSEEPAQERDRVSDRLMMWSMLVTHALNNMVNLKSFSWQIDLKILPIVYSGIADISTLETLKLKLPSSRDPTWKVTIPPMPQLKHLAITHIDHRCFQDDITLLLYSLRNLDSLTMHWSPVALYSPTSRFQLRHYFKRNIAHGRAIKTKKLVLVNHDNLDTTVMQDAIDISYLEEYTSLLCNTNKSDFEQVLLDATCRARAENRSLNLKRLRTNRFSTTYAKILSNFRGLEEFYFTTVSHHNEAKLQNALLDSENTSDSASETTSTESSFIKASRGEIKEFLTAICENHGQTMKCVLLPREWQLELDDVAFLIRNCPHLRQLGIALRQSKLVFLNLLFPFLSDLVALRVLQAPSDEAFAETILDLESQIASNGWKCWNPRNELSRLKWFAFGEKIFEVLYDEAVDRLGGEKSKSATSGKIRAVCGADVEEFEVWKMESSSLF